MKVRFEHITTEKRLHSHDIRPPISEVDFQNEVSAYGFPGFAGDANDDFFVELSKETRGGRDKRLARKRVRTLRSHFRLRHVMTGCYLFSHKVKLPEWGFEQQEVTCNKNPVWDNSLWYVETNTHAQLGPGSEKVNYHKPGFMAKFLELQAVMWQTNAGLTDRHAYDSRPSSWPWLRRGIVSPRVMLVWFLVHSLTMSWFSVCRTSGSKITVRFTLSAILSSGGCHPSLLPPILASAASSSFELNEASRIFATRPSRHTTKSAASWLLAGLCTISLSSSCRDSFSFTTTFPLFTSPFCVSAPSSTWQPEISNIGRDLSSHCLCCWSPFMGTTISAL